MGDDTTTDPTSLSYYFTPDQIASMPAQTKMLMEGVTQYFQNLTATGVPNVDVNQSTLNDALTYAESDPTILQKYGDEITNATADVRNTFNDATTTFNQQTAANARQAQTDTQNLGRQLGSAGQAYSGFAEQAKKNLAASEGDIIQSSRQTLGQTLSAAAKQYETRYGSPALNQLGLNSQVPVGVQLQTYGSDVGSYGGEREAAVESSAENSANVSTPPSASTAQNPT